MPQSSTPHRVAAPPPPDPLRTTLPYRGARNGARPPRVPRPWRRRAGPRTGRRTGLALAGISFWLGLLWAATIHPFGAPDEPAHLQAIMEIRTQYHLPELHFDFGTTPSWSLRGDPGNAATRDYAKSVGITDPYMLTPYESTQPPLYYLAAALAAHLVPPEPRAVLYISRLVAALFGAGTVYFLWAAMRQLALRAPMWAAATAGVVALLPQFCFNSATVSNDSAVHCLGAASFYVWFRGLRQPGYDPWLLRAGALLGLALLAKSTAVALLPGLALLILFRLGQARGWGARLRRGLRLIAGAAGAALLVSGWWWARNLLVYGEPTGYRDTLRMFATWARRLVPTDPASLHDFLQSTWGSSWGVFGWMSQGLPTGWYDQTYPVAALLLGLTGLAGLGLLLRRAVPADTARLIVPVAAILIAVCGALVAAFLQFNLTVAFQPQGRYLGLALLPAALLFTGGLYALPPGRRLKTLALSLPLLWLAGMNAVGLAVIR